MPVFLHVFVSAAGRFKWQLPAGTPAGVCEVILVRQVQDAGDSTVGVVVGVYRDTNGTLAGLSLVAAAHVDYNAAL